MEVSLIIHARYHRARNLDRGLCAEIHIELFERERYTPVTYTHIDTHTHTNTQLPKAAFLSGALADWASI